MRYALFFLLITSRLVAATDWLCTEEASQRKGDSIYACGIGYGPEEKTARSSAFDSAKAEFEKICSASDDCKMHRISVTPQRTACERVPKGIKCYRLIVFSIGEVVALKEDGTKTSPTKENSDSFESFDYSEIESAPKVRIGMRKADLLKAFGKPWNVDGDLIMFRGDMCGPGAIGGTCGVRIENGRVSNIQGFDFKYTEDLK